DQSKLLDQVRTMIRCKRMSLRTDKAYENCIKRFIVYHKKRHPVVMGEVGIRDFLNHLVVDQNVAPSTRNQALH
ncbi:MAG: phage integrase N-terminal SAM-like domain-containing protein, partial [Acidobacteria bacterium]|nr:phage integrase N-terminal SAM-like domain-containing protein [Acidobacteriota bacterium]